MDSLYASSLELLVTGFKETRSKELSDVAHNCVELQSVDLAKKHGIYARIDSLRNLVTHNNAGEVLLAKNFERNLNDRVSFEGESFYKEVESKLLSLLNPINDLDKVEDVRLRGSFRVDVKDCEFKLKTKRLDAAILLKVVYVEDHYTPHIKYSARLSETYIDGEKVSRPSKTKVLDILRSGERYEP